MLSRWLLISAACLTFGCALRSGPTSPKHPPATSDQEWSARTSALRPVGAEEALEGAHKDPKDPTAYALLADAYAGSDAPVMALAYGLYFRAMGTDCASDRIAAMAMARVITQKFVVTEAPDGTSSVHVSLEKTDIEPKQLSEGKRASALAVVLARVFERAAPGYKENTISEFRELLSRFIDSTDALGTLEELRGWLRATRDAGHLAAFSELALSAAYPDEFKKFQTTQAGELKAAQEYLDAHLFVPTRAPRADDPIASN